MTPEQQRAIAIAKARKRKAEAERAAQAQNRDSGRELAGGREQVAIFDRLDRNTRMGLPGRAFAAGLSAANSSTLGTLDGVLSVMDRTIPGAPGPSPSRVRGMLREQHPMSSTAGDLAGFLAPGGAIWGMGGNAAKALPKLPGRAAPYMARLAGLAGMGGVENAVYQSTVQASNDEADTGQPVALPQRMDMAKKGATNPLVLAAGPTASLMYRGGRQVFTGKATPKSLQPTANAPSLEEIGMMRDAAYKATDDMGVTYSPEGLQEMAVNLSQKLDSVNIDPHLHPRAHRVKEILQEKVQTGMSLPQLDNLRKFVRNNVVASNEPSEKMLGRMMVDEIDGFIGSGKHALTGSGEDAADAIVGARKLHQVHSKGQQIADAEEAARLRASSTGSGGNYENALRQELRKIYSNPKKIAGFSDAERASMLKVIQGDPIQNLMRNVGKLSPQGNGLMSALGIGTTAANPWLAPVWFAGMGAKHLAERGVKNKFDDLDRLVRSGASELPMKNVTPPKSAPPSPGALPQKTNPYMGRKSFRGAEEGRPARPIEPRSAAGAQDLPKLPSEAKALANKLDEDFEATAKRLGFADKWDAYKNDSNWPQELIDAHDRMIRATHHYYDVKGVTGMLKNYPSVTKTE